PGKENAPAETPTFFYSEIIGGYIGYVRVGSLNAANLQALDKSVANFAAKNVNALFVDLRGSQATTDLPLAAEFAKRFCPKGKTLFTLRKPAGHQDRVFGSERDPAFRGLVMVFADGDTAGAAEASAVGRGQARRWSSGRGAATPRPRSGKAPCPRSGVAALVGCSHLARGLSKTIADWSLTIWLP